MDNCQSHRLRDFQLKNILSLFWQGRVRAIAPTPFPQLQIPQSVG
ncbi:hypothetical protein FDUTEX481_07474 [Tolypothrix sp. PCC 7601]|nr:hypothetical protein FDUTEX481_07474 [Tolypothrix sp. PCC 7601]